MKISSSMFKSLLILVFIAISFGYGNGIQPISADSFPASESTLSIASCTNKPTFIKDVTIPDGTIVEPGESFVKIWRYRNDGTCTWNKNYKLVYSSGPRMGAKTINPLQTIVKPGQTVDITVSFTAPTTSGTHRSRWKLQAPDGTILSRPYAEIVVREVLGELAQELYYFGGGGGGFSCGDSPEKIPAIGDIAPANGAIFHATEVCLYGFPSYKRITLEIFTPDERYIVTFIPGDIGEEFTIYNSNGYSTGSTGQVVDTDMSSKISTAIAMYMFTPPYSTPGWWRISATSSYAKAEKSFEMPSPEPYVMVQDWRYHPFYSNLRCYEVGEMVKIVGGGVPPRTTVPLGIYYSEGLEPIPLIYSTIVKSDESGSFVHYVTIDESALPGAYLPSIPQTQKGPSDHQYSASQTFCVE